MSEAFETPVKSPDCAWKCSKCGEEPVFYNRAYWGFNMADAVCPNRDKPGHGYAGFQAKTVPLIP